MGIGITLAFVDTLIRWNSLRQEKRILIIQMGSDDNATAVNAVHLLDHRGWIMDGSLREAFLFNANLENALLLYADFQGVHLDGAILNNAELTGAILEQATLVDSSFKRSDLGDAKLTNADLSRADLQGSRRVTIEQLRQATSLQGATLPDGHELPLDKTWSTEFDKWCEKANVDGEGFIIPKA